MGETLIRAGKYTEGILSLDRAISANPGLAEVYYQKGLGLVATSFVEPSGRVVAARGAVETLRKYLELSPNSEHAPTVREMLRSLETH